MDPVSQAIIVALSAGMAGGVTETARKAIVDVYGGLKALLQKKFGNNSKAVEAIDKFQETPDSPKRREILEQELKNVNAAADQEVLSAAHSLLELIRALPNVEKHIQAAQGTAIAQADRGSTATVTMGGAPASKRDE